MQSVIFCSTYVAVGAWEQKVMPVDAGDRMNWGALLCRTLTIFSVLWGTQTACADATDVYKLASKSVVVVFAENSQGSGVLLSPQIVATNCHVVGDSTEAVVEFFGKKTWATLEIGRAHV